MLQREELDHCVIKVTHYTLRPSLQNKRTDLTRDYKNKRPLWNRTRKLEIISFVLIFRYIAFAMHLNIHYVYIHSKNYFLYFKLQVALIFLVHPFCYTSRYNNMSRYIAKWMNKKVKSTYNLKLREYVSRKAGMTYNLKQMEYLKLTW